MFVSLRRHQKWLWIVISVLTIISFVAFFSPRSQRGVGSGWRENDVVGSIYGHALHHDEYLQAAREARLWYFLRARQWPEEDEAARQFGFIERETRDRLLLSEKLKQLNITVSETAAAQWIADLFQDPQRHVFNQDFYNQFVKQTLPAKIGMQPRGFEEFVRHQVGIEHLISVYGITGRLVTPQEAEVLYRRENEQVDTKVILISGSNFLAQVTLDPAAIAAGDDQDGHPGGDRLHFAPARVHVRADDFISGFGETRSHH
jgi:IS1 family transposase